MGKVIVEQIVSADSFAQDAQGGIGFFQNARFVNEVDTEQLRMLSGVSAIVLGANTYRMFSEYWPGADPTVGPVAEPINRLPKFVVSSRLAAAPWGSQAGAQILRGDAVESIRHLRGEFVGNLIVWGSLTLTDALLCAGEVDVLRLRVLPLLLGKGRSFAPQELGLARLSLASSHAYDGGVLALEYQLAAAG